MASMEELNEEYIALQNEYNEYQIYAKETEENLENEISEKEEKLVSVLKKHQDAQITLEGLKKKLEGNEVEIARLQKEIDDLNKKIKKYDDQKQELEQLNDQ